MTSAPGKKDVKGCVAKTPRVLHVRGAGGVYGVAYGTQVYAALGGEDPLGVYRCTKQEAVPFYRKCNGRQEDLHDPTDEDSFALPDDLLVSDLEKGGWLRFAGTASERWLPLEGSGLVLVEQPPGLAKPRQVPPGWEILTWQACQGTLLKTVVASFEWKADAVVVQDTMQARFLRIGTKRSDRPGAVLGDANVQVNGTEIISVDGDTVLVTRPMIGVTWGEDMFDFTGLMSDAGYVAAAAGGFAVRPSQRELEAEALEAGQQALAAEVRGSFSSTPPSASELVRCASREAGALRRLWAHNLWERRLLRVHEGLVQISAASGEAAESASAEDAATTAAVAAAAAAEQDFDPMQIWVQVALGSILELAACIPQQAGAAERTAFGRLITRATKSFAAAAPLSLFGAGQLSQVCLTETVSALEMLVQQMPCLKPAALEMLLTLATVSGSARLVAQALQWLLTGAGEACAARCVAALEGLWQLGSALHFEVHKVQEIDKRLDRKAEAAVWRFVHVSSCSRPASSLQRLRSNRTISFEDPFPGDVYWEVTVRAADRGSVALGVWLESKKKPVGCRIADGSPLGAGAVDAAAAAAAEPGAGGEAASSPAEAQALPEVTASPGGAVYGLLATMEDLVMTCNGQLFSRIPYKRMLCAGERLAIFVEHGQGTSVHVNVGQEPFLHLPTPAGTSAEGLAASTAVVPWGRACDPYSECPCKAFSVPPATARDVAQILVRITERNVGRLGSTVDNGTPVHHTFTKCEQMTIAEDGAVVNNLRENSWARLDCEITVGVSVEFCFEVLDDRENDEGTCYGLSTAECSKYDSRGSFVLRGYSGHLYCDGSDKGEKFPKIHPRSRVTFRLDYSEGLLEAWLDDQEPRVLINDPSLFGGRTLYPTVFNYHGTRTKVKLLRCSSGLRNRAALQDSFALEVAAPAAELWLSILEQILAPVRGTPLASPESEQASGPAATVLKVLLATANVSPNIWVEFGAIRSRIMNVVEFVVIERRNDTALQQPRDVGILLISVLGVGALFGGPEQVLKVFLSVCDSQASRLGQTLVAYLLGTRRAVPIAASLLLGLSRLAVTDALGCQILLRLMLNAFMNGVENFKHVACSVLELVSDLGEALDVGFSAPAFAAELLPAMAQLLAAAPRREPAKLPVMLELLVPASRAMASLRRAAGAKPLGFVKDALHGLNTFVCGIAGLLMSCSGSVPFPLDLGGAELRDGAASAPLLPPLAAAQAAVDAVAGPRPLHVVAGPPVPELIEQILGAFGHGEALVTELQQRQPQSAASPSTAPTSPLPRQPVSAVQRTVFATVLLCKGPEVIEAILNDTSVESARSAWQEAQVFVNNKVRAMKHSIAANEGCTSTFETALVAQLSWLVRHITWWQEVVPPSPLDLCRSATAPDVRPKPPRLLPERALHLGRFGEELQLTSDSKHSLAKALEQLVGGATGTTLEPLVAAAGAQRDAAVGRCLGLRLLRFLVREAVHAEGLNVLLPTLQAALEETLSHPMHGVACAGLSWKQAMLEELAALLKEVHGHCAAASVASPSSLAMFCVPLLRHDLELMLGHLLSGLPSLALDNGGAVNHSVARAAQLVLRIYICSSGRRGPALSAVLGQIAAALDTSLGEEPGEVPLPFDLGIDQLVLDWDFGTFGRLCPRNLDATALAKLLPTKEAASDEDPSAARFELSDAMSLTLKELRKQRATGVLPAAAASQLLLRLPQGSREEASVDPIEALQALGGSDAGGGGAAAAAIWPAARRPGAVAAALTLLRPAAELLLGEVPGFVDRLLKIMSLGAWQRLPAALAVCLYFKLHLPDERLAADAPFFISLLGEAGRLAEAPVPACRGSLAFATLLARQMTSRARAMSGAVWQALDRCSPEELCTDAGARAALELVGGPSRCAACQTQVLATVFGRALVVGADAQHVAVLSLDGAADAKAVQWVQWADLQVPPRHVSAVAGVGRASLWGERIVHGLFSAVRHLLETRRGRIPPELLRAVAAVLPSSPCWDVAIVTEVVRELDDLAAAGAGDVPGGAVELLEHRWTLLRLALRHDRQAACEERAAVAPSSVPTSPCPSRRPGAAVVGSRASGSPAAAAAASPLPLPPLVLSPAASPAGPGVDADAAAGSGEAPSIVSILSQGAEWRGRYKLKRHTNTWYKLKWHMELHLAFHPGGALDVVARWPKFPQPSPGRSASWQLEEGGGGISLEFSAELPAGRREGGRTRDAEIFVWKGRLVQTRGCPHLEGTAVGRTTDLKYEWYAVPPDPLALLRSASEFELFGKADDGLPRPFSLLGFNTGFIEQKAEHFSGTLGLVNFNKADGTARDLALAAVQQLSIYQYISGPREVAKVAKQSSEERWGMRDSLDEDDGSLGGPAAVEERWCSLGEVLGEEGGGAGPALELAPAMEREERQLRLAILMRVLQVMLAHRPASAAVASCFRDGAAREAFFRRALRLPDAGVVLSRCAEDFATSADVAHSALTVAVEGLLTPFMAGGVSTLTVESDHDYHPNEDWAFKLSIPGASRMKLKFDSRCRTELGRDFLQFFSERDLQGNFTRRLHAEEKICGQFPGGFPDLHLPGDNVWLRFQSDGSEQFWGFRLTLTGEGGGSGAAAVPFPAALKLLVATANAVPEAERPLVRAMGASVLLSVSAAQPLSDEATRAAEALCELLPEPCQWSSGSWSTALSLMSLAERNGRRQLLASLVTLLSKQLGPRTAPGNTSSPALLLDSIEPSSGGLLLNGRTTLLAGAAGRCHAFGLPVPSFTRAGHALFCVRVEPTSGLAGAGADAAGSSAASSAAAAAAAPPPGGTGLGVAIGVGVALVTERGGASDTLEAAIFCEATRLALPGEELSVEVQRAPAVAYLSADGTVAGGAGSAILIVSGRHGSVSKELPAAFASAANVLPAMWVEGFGATLTLRPPPSGGHDSEAAAERLEQLQRSSRLVEACRGGRGSSLPAALIAGAWARLEGGDEVDVAAVQERLRSRCISVAESEHPHAWGVISQKLEVPGASALELTFPRIELAEGYRLRVAHDAAGDMPVMKQCVPPHDGSIQHTVEFGKYIFATLDDVDPQCKERGQQEAWLKLPLGWELAPEQGAIAAEVIAKHHWASDALVFENGDAIYTLCFENGSKAGQCAGKDKLALRGSDLRVQYQPCRVAGRVLIRRMKPDAVGQGQALPLEPEELAPGERVVVPCGTVYIHGPLPQLPRWDAVHGTVDCIESCHGQGEEPLQAAAAEATSPGARRTPPGFAPLLCCGSWVWAFSRTQWVELSLQPSGEVQLSKSTFPNLGAAELEEMRSAQAACAEALDPSEASWADPATFRLAAVSGCWDSIMQNELQLEVEGADASGVVALRFSSTGPPCLEAGVVAIPGEVAHRRWGRIEVAVDGYTCLGAKVASSWHVPDSDEAALEIQVLGYADPEAATSIQVLTATEAMEYQDVTPAKDSDGPPRGGPKRSGSDRRRPQRLLVLHEGEYLERVNVDGGLSAGTARRMEALTNRGRSVAWPPSDLAGGGGEPSAQRSGGEYRSPDFCEVMAFTPPSGSMEGSAASSKAQMACRPLVLGEPPPIEAAAAALRASEAHEQRLQRQRRRRLPARLPDGLWEGTLQVDGAKMQAVRCRISVSSPASSSTAPPRGAGAAAATFTGVVEVVAQSEPGSSTVVATVVGHLSGGELDLASGAAAALFAPRGGGDGLVEQRSVEGRCTVDSKGRVCLLLACGIPFPRHDHHGGTMSTEQRKGIRLALRSRARVGHLDHRLSSGAAAPTVDGASLVYQGHTSGERYVMHAASDPWTKQIASNHLVAEVAVQQLAASPGGLLVGLAEPGGSTGNEAELRWPGESTSRWFWRSDGSMVLGPGMVQQRQLWRFGAGDTVGFAVGASHVTFLLNGEKVRTVPRRLRGRCRAFAADAPPALVVGLAGDTVLRLCEGAQHLALCEDVWREPGHTLSGATVAPSPALAGRRGHTPPGLLLRRWARSVLWLVRLTTCALGGPSAWEHAETPAEPAKPAAAGASPGPALDTIAAEPDVWVEATPTGTMPCFSKGRTLEGEIGGSQAIKELIVAHYASQNRPEEEATAAEARQVDELFINELGPLDSDRFTTAKVSVRVREGQAVRFRQAALERSPAGTWRVVEILGDGSGKGGDCRGLQRLAAGAEVTAASIDGGWLQVSAAEAGARRLWYPITDEASGAPRFVRKKDVALREEPIFSLAAARHFAGAAVRGGAAADASEPCFLVPGLPVGDEPYTVEARVRLPPEDSGREMCVAAWGDAQGLAERGLAVHDSVASPSGSLTGTRKVCDGGWHHIACTFDGKERRMWVDQELVAHDVLEVRQNAPAPAQNTLWLGRFPQGPGAVQAPRGLLHGDVRQLHVWKVALTPAAMRAYGQRAELRVQEEIAVEAMKVAFQGMDVRGDGELSACDLEAALGGAGTRFMQRLDRTARGHVSCDDWVRFCCELRQAGSTERMMLFLQACARNLGQRRRTLRVQEGCQHPQEVLAALSLSSCSYGWRIEAKPVSLSDAMLESIEDEGLERFRRGVRVAHALLGQSADEAIVELADRVALQQGNHDDCWTKMLTLADWSQAQPRWVQQAVTHAKLDELTPLAKLQESLAWSFAGGRSLSEAIDGLGTVAGANMDALKASWSEAGQRGGGSDVFAPMARVLMQSISDAAQIDTLFRQVVGRMLLYRFLILLELNWSVSRDFLPLIDLAASADSVYGRLLAQVKPRLLGHLKFSKFQQLLQSTKYEGNVPSIILNRKAAITFRERGRVDWEFRRSLIGQLITEMRKHAGGPKLFRRAWQSRCMKVQFKGEGGEDAGGLYREALDAVAQELHSKAVPLLVPCPNAVAEVGDNRDAWLLNPRATTPECVRALEFVGQLLGLALRTGDLLPLNLAPFTWKGIVGDERKRDDVRSIDVFADRQLSVMATEEQPDRDPLAAVDGLQFAYPDVTGEETELVEGGRDVAVTPENAPEFARLLLQSRLTFDRCQLEALRRGLATVVPIQLIRLWGWRDLQERVCGVPDVDLENLKRHTTYKNCTSTNVHVGYMWEALEAFSQQHRRAFLRFVWGRSSMPTVEKWERNFTIQLLSGTDDSRLPCSHTCFFTLDLPTFSSTEVCSTKLLYCITHCLAIDADGAAARAMNWDEDEDD